MYTYNSSNNNPYGHLLDKYLDADHLDWEIKQQRKKEAEKKYGHLLDYAEPDNSTLELMAKMEDERMERRKQEAGDKELADQRRQAYIEEARRREEEHNTKVRNYAESFIVKKREQIKAEADKKEQERKEAEKQQKIHNMIGYLADINPETAEAYIQALKKGGCI